MAQVFRTPMSELNRLPLWALNDLVALAREQAKDRDKAARKSAGR